MEIERSHDSASVKQTRIFSFLNARRRDAVSQAWEMALAFIVHAPLDLVTLERAFRSTMQKHVEARSAFREVDGALRVDTLPTSYFGLTGAPTRRLAPDEAIALARQEAQRPFMSFEGPLVALRVFPQTDATTLIALQVSHLVADGVAVEMLVNDLMLAYFAGGVASPGSGERAFYEYIDWEEAFLASEQSAAQRAFWAKRQRGEYLRLPYDAPGDGDAILNGGVLRFDIGAVDVETTVGIARRAGVTPFSVLLTIFMRSLSDWSRHDDLSMSFALARRHRREFAGAFGDLAFASPIDCAVARSRSFDDGLRSVAAEIEEMTQNQDFPIAALAPDWRSTKPIPAQGPPGLPRVSFGPLSGLRRDAFGLSGLLHAPAGTREKIVNIEVESVNLGTMTCARDLLVSYIPRPRELTFVLNYNADRFDTSTIMSLQEAIKEQIARL